MFRKKRLRKCALSSGRVRGSGLDPAGGLDLDTEDLGLSGVTSGLIS